MCPKVVSAGETLATIISTVSASVTKFEKKISGWTPEITIQANLAGCPVYRVGGNRKTVTL